MTTTKTAQGKAARKAPVTATTTADATPLPGMVIGYARTSSQDQVAGLEAQVRDLEAAGCARVFSEQVSSVAPSRPELERCLSFLREGDRLVICKPDRLARSVSDLLRIIADLDRRKVALTILSMGGERIDTSNPTSRLILTILAGVAAWEREIMLERQRAGIEKARREGRYKGRPVSFSPEKIWALADQGMQRRDIARELGCDRATISRAMSKRPAPAATAA